MGKHTWMSLGKPLDGRTNVILTHDTDFSVKGCLVVNSIEQVLDEFADQELFVIGGADIFKQFLPFTSKIYLTRIMYVFSGDTYFPGIQWNDWSMISYEQIKSESGHNLSFETWEKKKPSH
jgi:dihydrofolate reductase